MCFLAIQWDLKSGLVWIKWILNGQKEVGLQIKSETRKPNHLKSRQIDAILSKTIWNLDKNVRIFNGPDFEWLKL